MNHFRIYFCIKDYLKHELGIYSKAFWIGYPLSSNKKHIPADSFLKAYEKYVYFSPS